MTTQRPILTVGLAGLGAIGLPLARALDDGVPGLRLVAVSARDRQKAAAGMADFGSRPEIVDLAGLAGADIVVEAAPASVFEQIAAFGDRGRRGSLCRVRLARCCPGCICGSLREQTGARIVVPTGALLGLDAVRAAAEGPIESVTIETRKPPLAWPARRICCAMGSTSPWSPNR